MSAPAEKLTPAARMALVRARDFGSPWASSDNGYLVWSASRQRLINRLRDRGWLKGDRITEAGLAALNYEGD